MPNPKLKPEAIAGLTQAFLLPQYDDPAPIPTFHMEFWEACCSDHPFVAIAAPRSSAKSTAITHALVLASVLFRYKKNVLIISNTEEQGIGFLAGIKGELGENKELIETFGIAHFEIEAVRQIVVRFKDGAWFRIVVRGAGQRLRGTTYRNMRPDLIICDDIEDDETCENDDRRAKFRRWFLKVLLPLRSPSSGQIRMVGTILHEDSVLAQLMRSKSWKTLFYKAHNAFDDFSNLLWPDVWPEDKLREVRQAYIEQGEPELYSQEYLNDPRDLQNPFFDKNDLLPMQEADHKKYKEYYCGVDFAASEREDADFNVFTVIGVDDSGILYVVDVRRGRGADGWDTNVVINEFFVLQEQYGIEQFFVEGGVIWNTLEPSLLDEQVRRQQFFDCEAFIPSQDKKVRARPLQKLFRQHRVKVDDKAEWYHDWQDEILGFPKAVKKDQVDSAAWTGIGILNFIEAPTDEQLQQAEYEREMEESLSVTYDPYGVAGV